jgi:Amt family ammonium transporter
MEALKTSSDTLFILLGAILVLAMHAGFAFLEVGTVRKKNQVNALVKILCDFSMSTIAYFFVGYAVAYGVDFFAGADKLAEKSGYDLVKFFFLLTFAAAVPAIISGASPSARASRRSSPQPQSSSVSFTRSSRESPGTTAMACRHGSKA